MCIVLSLIFLLWSCLSVYAVDNASIHLKIDMNFSTDTVTVEGRSDIANEIMSIVVLNPNGALEEIGQNKEFLQHQRTFASKDNGTFEYQFELNLNEHNSNGSYAVYVGARSSDALAVKHFYIAPSNEKLKCAQDLINASAAQLPERLSNEEYSNILVLGDYGPYFAVNKSLLADRIYSVLKQTEIKPDINVTISKIQLLIKEFSLLEAYNQGLGVSVFSQDKSFLYPEILGFNKLKQTRNLTVYEIYNSLVNETGKGLVRNALLRKNCNNLDSLRDLFVEQVILIGVTNPSKTGFGHVRQILTDDNMKAVGLTLKKSLTDEAAAAVAAQSGGFNSIAQLQTFLDGVLSDTVKDTGRASGSTSGGGFSVAGEVSSVVAPDSQNEQNNQMFADLHEVAWAKESILKLAEKGILSYSNQFKPNDAVTREQFAKMVCMAFEIEATSEDSGFNDVDASQWYSDFVSGAKKAGIIKGKSQDMFGVGEPITRQDLCVMLYRAMNAVTGVQQDAIVFDDNHKIADYAIESVATLTAMEVINGYDDNTFRPNHLCTRAEAAKLIYSIIRLREGELQ